MKRCFFLFIVLVSGLLAEQICGDDCEGEVAELQSSDRELGDLFGNAVSMSGNTIIVGSFVDDEVGIRSGSATIFELIDGTWTEVAKLVPDDGDEEDRFGSAVCIDGDTAIIGAPNDDDNGSQSGSAYVFVKEDGIWTQQAKLVARDGGSHNYFGNTVGISKNRAVVGAHGNDEYGDESGAAYIFARSNGAWSQRIKLVAQDIDEEDRFGASVAIDGHLVVVGSVFDDDNGLDTGAAYVFERKEFAWEQVSKLLADDACDYDYFGKSVCIDGQTIIIGAWATGDNGAFSGSAYAFANVDNDWTLQAKLLPEKGAENDMFGLTVSVSENISVIGARNDDENGADSGSAFIFRRLGSDWIEESIILPSDGRWSDEFGYAVAISGRTIAIGAPLHEDDIENSGAIYVFDAECSICFADTSRDHQVDAEDMRLLLANWGPCLDCSSDIDHDGEVGVRDLLALLLAWGPC